ncbi:MAG: serine aminopeptidase domain-containing protein [Planctomycetota bacterium]|jgi:pimeloyl-ACP methyl ester carboxylesterase
MTAVIIIVCIIGGLLAYHQHAGAIGHMLQRKGDEVGDPQKGLAIMVESVRWVKVPWGRWSTLDGLRRAGFEGSFRFWSFHPLWRAWLVLPVIAAPKFLERQSQELADFITDQRRAHPDRPIYVMGYSAGGFVAVRAVELLPDDVRVDGVGLLAAAFSPWRDLSTATSKVPEGRFVVSSSILDWMIVGFGTLLFGTCDRVFTPSIGMIGCRGASREFVSEVRWRPGLVRCGHFGDHFSASVAGLVEEHIAPRMLGTCGK